MLSVAGLSGCSGKVVSPVERARIAWDQQKYAESAEAYEEFLASAPQGDEAEEAEFLLADIYNHNLKDFERAREHYTAFLDRYPSSPHAYDARERLAEVCVELKNLREAINQYELLSQEFPDSPERRKTRATIADLYFQLNDFDQAELEYGRVLDNAPYDTLSEQALLRLASIYHLVRNQDERSLALYDRVAEYTNDPAVRRNALYSLSEAYARLFRFDEAIDTLKRITEPEEAQYVASRSEELERQKKEHAGAPPEIDWSKGKGEGDADPPAVAKPKAK
jgi:tetratricopeptide (TPR) repeat protein